MAIIPNQVPWNECRDQALKELKRRFCHAPVLWSKNFSLPFVVQTDASERGVGAILSQYNREGNNHPIAYFSRKLLSCEVNYSTIKKECLAIQYICWADLSDGPPCTAVTAPGKGH